jgi:hypothetical protein
VIKAENLAEILKGISKDSGVEYEAVQLAYPNDRIEVRRKG